jgi:acyl-coenzyme A synthetase/AMP-(fatty) acid ligase
MRTRLPDYMVPAQIVFMEDMPLNDNGKIDRRASSARLHDLLAQGGVAQAADRAHLASATGAFQ